MTLSFRTQINDRPNWFVEKIINGLAISHKEAAYLHHLYQKKFNPSMDFIDVKFANPLFPHHPKIHTIRADEKDRWKVGNKIHFVINNRTKNRFQFAPVITVKSIQKIEIVYWMGCGDYPAVVIDGQTLKNREVETLAKNDGFDSVEDFFSWFNSDFKGKIIHWTDCSYCG